MPSSKKENFFQKPVKPFSVEKGSSAAALLRKMQDLSFQARNLGTALQVWADALQDEAVIFLGLAGAMVPAGMRRIIVHLIQNRLVDCIVSTGANLFHDCQETLGYCHYKGSPDVDDVELFNAKVDRIYDTFASDLELDWACEFIAKFSDSLDPGSYSTWEFLHLLGKHLRDNKEEGILNSACQHRVPIFCPAIADSSIAIAMTPRFRARENAIHFDLVKDVIDSADAVARAKGTAVIYVGGGTPKNFIQQAEVTAKFNLHNVRGHQYAIQITTDAPHWGGLSGCTLTEAQSWGKIAENAQTASVACDATIAFPLLVSALAELDIQRTPPAALGLSGSHGIEL